MYLISLHVFLLIELYYSFKQTVVELKFHYFYVKLLFLAIFLFLQCKKQIKLINNSLLNNLHKHLLLILMF